MTAFRKKQGSSAAMEYMDNRQSAVAQMEKNPVQRKLTMQDGFDGWVFDAGTDDGTLRDFADELFDDDPEYAQNNTHILTASKRTYVCTNFSVKKMRGTTI
jgi:hypothetical protein